MKKGNEHHLALIVDSRVLKLQKLARCFYRTRMRAALKIQTRLKILLERKHKAPTSITPSVVTNLLKSGHQSRGENNFTPRNNNCDDSNSMLTPKSPIDYRGLADKGFEHWFSYANKKQ